MQLQVHLGWSEEAAGYGVSLMRRKSHTYTYLLPKKNPVEMLCASFYLSAMRMPLDRQDAGEGGGARARARRARYNFKLKSKAVRAVYLSFIIVRNNDTHSTDATRDSRHAFPRVGVR